jgi:hypothetical protein
MARMKKQDTLFSRKEIRVAILFTVLYAGLATAAQVLTPEDKTSPTLRLRPPMSADAAMEGVVDAAPLDASAIPALPTQTVTTG